MKPHRAKHPAICYSSSSIRKNNVGKRKESVRRENGKGKNVAVGRNKTERSAVEKRSGIVKNVEKNNVDRKSEKRKSVVYETDKTNIVVGRNS